MIGVEAGDPFVASTSWRDGPHAVVAGVTGSGKSELLVTWILALCAAHSTREVSFLLADFKGGTAFDALARMPHVTGVITDLDGAGARRAIESLRAEVRWREAELSRVGARDILDPRVDLPRLVIVVDEFAALLGEHPELHAVFTDVAARGRALGMHLVLGTQRPAGVVRESLLANCPLRISLRVTDPTDSRALLGTDEAAALPGGAGCRGLALVRGASRRLARDACGSRSRRLRTHDAIAAAADGPPPRRPWLPELPARIDLEDLLSIADDGDDALLVGLADEPDAAASAARWASASMGAACSSSASAGSGKTNALHALAAQARGEVVWVPTSGEGAWDAVADLSDRSPAPGSVVVIDDLDALGGAPARRLCARAPRAAGAARPRRGRRTEFLVARGGPAADRRASHGWRTCCLAASCLRRHRGPSTSRPAATRPLRARRAPRARAARRPRRAGRARVPDATRRPCSRPCRGSRAAPLSGFVLRRSPGSPSRSGGVGARGHPRDDRSTSSPAPANGTTAAARRGGRRRRGVAAPLAGAHVAAVRSRSRRRRVLRGGVPPADGRARTAAVLRAGSCHAPG